MKHAVSETTRWSGALAAFGPEFRAELSRMADAIDRFVAKIPRADTARTGEPAGYDGLAARGPLERLLVSEWLLASEIPEEFVRRAATGEQAYYSLARERGDAKRGALVLLDAGPESLGGPRVVQLAALAVFSERANALGHTLRWGVLQGTEVYEGIDEAGLRAFVAARSIRAAAEHDVERLRERAERDGAVAERWIVAPPAVLATAGAGYLRLEVRDLYEAGPRRVALRDARKGTAARSITIELPGDAECNRLLVTPWAAPARTVATTASREPPRGVPIPIHPRSELRLGCERLIVRGARGEHVAFSLSRLPGGRVERYVRPANERGFLVGIRHRRGRFTALVHVGGVLERQGGGHSSRGGSQLREQVTLGEVSFDTAEGPAGVERALRTRRRWVEATPEAAATLVDPLFADFGKGGSWFGFAGADRSELVLMDYGVAAASVVRIVPGVKAVGAAGRALRYAISTNTSSGPVLASWSHERSMDASILGAADSRDVFYGYSGQPSGLFGARVGTSDTFTIVPGSFGSELTVVVPADEKVVGLGGIHGWFGVVTLDATRRVLSLRAPSQLFPIARSDAEIETVTVATDGPYVAYRDVEGSIVVVSLECLQPVLNVFSRSRP